MPSSDQMTSTWLPTSVRSRWRATSAQRREPSHRKGQHHHPPVADLVAETLHHDRAIAGSTPVGLPPSSRKAARLSAAHGPAGTGRPASHEPRGSRARQGEDQLADRTPQLERTAGGSPCQKGSLAAAGPGRAERSPRRGLSRRSATTSIRARTRRPAGSRDHLLVQLTHPTTTGQHHGVQPAMGMVPRLVTASIWRCRGRTVPVARSQTMRGRSRRTVGRSAVRRHVEDPLEARRDPSTDQVAAPRTSPYSSSAVAGPAVTMATSCWAARRAGPGAPGRLDRPGEMRSTTTVASSRSARCLGRCGHARRPHLVPGPPDPLSPLATDAGDSTRSTRSTARHVDPQLEGRGGHHRSQLSLLELGPDGDPLLPRHQAVVHSATSSAASPLSSAANRSAAPRL